MKKKIFGGIAVIAIAGAMALSVSLNAKNNNLSSISLANVEALANGEFDVALCTAEPLQLTCMWFCGIAGRYIAGNCP